MLCAHTRSCPCAMAAGAPAPVCDPRPAPALPPGVGSSWCKGRNLSPPAVLPPPPDLEFPQTKLDLSRGKWQRLLCQQDGSGSHRHFHSRARRRPTNPMHRRSPTARAAILRVLTTTDTSTSPFLRARRPRASPGKLQGLPTLPLA